jgi:hypothetical protein
VTGDIILFVSVAGDDILFPIKQKRKEKKIRDSYNLYSVRIVSSSLHWNRPPDGVACFVRLRSRTGVADYRFGCLLLLSAEVKFERSKGPVVDSGQLEAACHVCTDERAAQVKIARLRSVSLQNCPRPAHRQLERVGQQKKIRRPSLDNSGRYAVAVDP